MNNTAAGEKRKKILFIALAAATPAALAVYSLVQLKSPLTFWWAVDALLFTVLYLSLFFLLPANRAVRVPAAFLYAGWFVFFHVGNVIYYRYFDTWVHQDIFDQWQDATGIGSAVRQLFSPMDIIFGIAAPMAAALAAASLKAGVRRRVLVPALAGLGAVLFTAHMFVVGPKTQSRHNEPMMYFVRIPLYGSVEKIAAEKRVARVRKDLKKFYPYDESAYRREPDKPGRLTLVPSGGEKGPDKPYNVVMILMESVVAAASGTYGASPSFTPTIDGLATRSLVAKNFYANGSQTVRGEMSLLCSFYENLRGGPVYIKYYNRKIRCLPEILSSNGYETMWISSYKKSYSQKSRFLTRHGVRKIYDIESLPPGYKKIGWGPSDEDLFDSAAERLDGAKQPFFAEIMTLSNHYPFTWPYASNPFVPENSLTGEYANYMRGIYYTDWVIGKFLERARNSPWFANTVFIITGDHGIWLFPEGSEKGPIEKQEAYFRVPFLIYAPGIVEPKIFEDAASQADMAPTVLDILGIRAKNAFVGRSLLRSFEQPRFALMIHDRKWNIRRGHDYCYDVGQECFTDHIPWCKKGQKTNPDRSVSCFRFDGDLLGDPSRWAGQPDMQENSPLEKFALHLNDYNQYLLKKDQIYR